MYNHSLFSADRATYFKIIVVPLVLGALVTFAAVDFRPGEADADPHARSTVRAGHGPSIYAEGASGILR